MSIDDPLPPTTLMRLACTEQQAQKIADLILEAFDPEATAVSTFERVTSTKAWSTEDWMVEAHFGTPPDQSLLEKLVASVTGEAFARNLEFGSVDQRDWVAASLEGLRPVRAGRFLIHGAHDRSAVRANDIGIEIEAALAFGTGHHGSTLGCLMLLNERIKQGPAKQILDVGTGSGVLAIAAARAFKRKISAGDIDGVCVASATANAKANRVAGFLRPVKARGADHILLRQNGPYDLIFANILARPLRQLAPSLAKLTARGGTLILSGLLDRDVAGVLSAYRAQNLFLVKRIDIEGWASLLLQRRA
jgi:ribosomal protein L11 methyltransferase